MTILSGQTYLDQIGTKMITKAQVKHMMKLYNPEDDESMNHFKYYYKKCINTAMGSDLYKSKLFFFLFPGDHSPTLSEELYNLNME
jgi:hypothetical protein